jgi:hypothetical protein
VNKLLAIATHFCGVAISKSAILSSTFCKGIPTIFCISNHAFPFTSSNLGPFAVMTQSNQT